MKKAVINGSSILILILFVLNNAWAAEITESSLNKLMALSGLSKQIAEFPGMVLAGIQQAKQRNSKISDEEFEYLQKEIQDAFQPAQFLHTIGMEIKNNISESEAKELFKWYESDLGMKITKGEENASTPAAYKEMFRESKSLLADEKRVTLAKKLESLINNTEMAMQLQKNAATAVFTAVSTATNKGQCGDIEAFKAQMNAHEQKMRANIEKIVILSLVYCYKDIDIGSIEQYVKFNERPITRKFNESVLKGLENAFNRSIDKMAKSLAAMFKNKANN